MLLDRRRVGEQGYLVKESKKDKSAAREKSTWKQKAGAWRRRDRSWVLYSAADIWD